MDESMTMNRVIHGAVRRDLARVETGLRSMAAGEDRARLVAATWDNLAAFLHEHHVGEDTYLWPWLREEGVDAALLDAMEAEHGDLAAALDRAGAAVRTACAGGDAAAAARSADVVAEATTVVERHLRHEESELEPLVIARMETPGWKPVEKGLRKGSIAHAGRFFAWVTDDIAPDHAAYLRATIPAPVVGILARLFGGSYRREIAAGWS